MKDKNKIIENFTRKEDSCKLKVEDMCVEMAYSENDKSFKECMLNVLKQKIKES